MLSSLKRSCRGLSQGVLWRGFATHQQGWAGSHHERRRPLPAPAAPPTPPEKIEWWAVDGELFKAEKFDPKRVLAPLENDHIPNRVRRKQRIKHLGQTRLKLKAHGQESYWAAYMKRFQAMRDEWERHVWDPVPIPLPKPRKMAWVAEENEKYVWKDPRREAFTFDVSRMDYSGARARFDNKIGYKAQGMNRYPADGHRDAGGSGVRSGMAPMRRDSYKDSRYYESAHKDERYGHQRSTNVGRRNSRTFECDDFEDVFEAEDGTSSDEDAAENRVQAGRHGKQAGALATEDDEDDSSAEFSWDASDSEEANGDEEDNSEDKNVSDSRIQRPKPDRRGRRVKEEDLFKD